MNILVSNDKKEWIETTADNPDNINYRWIKVSNTVNNNDLNYDCRVMEDNDL